MEGVRTDLDSGADFAQLRRALQHDAGEALAREAKRRGKAADAAARDHYGQILHE